jgi:dephospho-CoA kinase
MLTIGLTGGIASGKTTVSDLFGKLGVPVIDTDLISRALLEPDQPGYKQVVEHFGKEVLQNDQLIDRHKLRYLIFNDETEKHWLETTLHPIIFQQTKHQIEQYKTVDYILVVIPLLFETDFQTLVNRILVIDCNAKKQIRRLMARDNIELKLAQQMLAQQWRNDDRLNRADDVIHNNIDRSISLEQQVAKLHQKYVSLARAC